MPATRVSGRRRVPAVGTIAPDSGIRVRVYSLMREAVEEGLAVVVRRVTKHLTDERERAVLEKHEAAIVEKAEIAIMGAICERFRFPEED